MIFFDSLYGEINLEIPLEVLISPELQRLREVRLCNINSPFITGGANLNRFEHAIGTAYLAQEFTKLNSIQDPDKNAFILSAILHDVVTAPFGHSFEYLLDAIKGKKYQHANVRKMILSGKTVPYSRNFFLSRKASLSKIIKQETLDKINEILEGNHILSKYISNTIDLDNIDNVFRFAYHIGISFDKSIPIRLSNNLIYRENQLVFKPETLPLFEEWYNIRYSLYKYLLENPGEFVAKALLERCLIECIKDDIISEFDWILTDSDLVSRINLKGNKIAKNCIERLMMMDFPKKAEIMYSTEYKLIDAYLFSNKYALIDIAFNNGIFLHFIRDVNKTRRVLYGKILVSDYIIDKIIGIPDDRYLIGIFSDELSSIKKGVDLLSKNLPISLKRLPLEGKNDSKQKSIFDN